MPEFSRLCKLDLVTRYDVSSRRLDSEFTVIERGRCVNKLSPPFPYGAHLIRAVIEIRRAYDPLEWMGRGTGRPVWLKATQHQLAFDRAASLTKPQSVDEIVYT